MRSSAMERCISSCIARIVGDGCAETRRPTRSHERIASTVAVPVALRMVLSWFCAPRRRREDRRGFLRLGLLLHFDFADEQRGGERRYRNAAAFGAAHAV